MKIWQYVESADPRKLSRGKSQVSRQRTTQKCKWNEHCSECQATN